MIFEPRYIHLTPTLHPNPLYIQVLGLLKNDTTPPQ